MALSTVDTEEENLVLSAVRSVMDKYSGWESVLAEFMQICEGAGKQAFGNFCQKLVKTMRKKNKLEYKKGIQMVIRLIY